MELPSELPACDYDDRTTQHNYCDGSRLWGYTNAECFEKSLQHPLD